MLWGWCISLILFNIDREWLDGGVCDFIIGRRISRTVKCVDSTSKDWRKSLRHDRQNGGGSKELWIVNQQYKPLKSDENIKEGIPTANHHRKSITIKRWSVQVLRKAAEKKGAYCSSISHNRLHSLTRDHYSSPSWAELSGRNSCSVIFGALFMWLGNMNTKKNWEQIPCNFWNVLQETNGKSIVVKWGDKWRGPKKRRVLNSSS